MNKKHTQRQKMHILLGFMQSDVDIKCDDSDSIRHAKILKRWQNVNKAAISRMVKHFNEKCGTDEKELKNK